MHSKIHLGERQMATDADCRILFVAHCIVQLADNSASVLKKYFSRFSWFNMARRELEECHLHVLLKISNHATEGGLHGSKSFRSTMKVQFFGDSHEGFELLDIAHRILIAEQYQLIKREYFTGLGKRFILQHRKLEFRNANQR